MRYKQPTVCVVIPTYNRHALLRRCVYSVVNDVKSNSDLVGRLSVVVADDGSSSQEALNTLSDLEKELPKELFRVLRLAENSGGAAAPRNAALDIIESDYVFFVDSDDYLGDEAIRRLLAILEDHCPDYLYLNSVNVGRRSDASGTITVEYEERQRIDALSSLVVRRVFKNSIIKKLGLRFDEYLKSGQDVLFAFQFMLNASTFAFSGGYDYYHLVAHKLDSEEGHLSHKVSDGGISWALRASYSVHTLQRGLAELLSRDMAPEEKERIASQVLLSRVLPKFSSTLKKVTHKDRQVGLFRDMANIVTSGVYPKSSLRFMKSKFRPMVESIFARDLDRFLSIDL